MADAWPQFGRHLYSFVMSAAAAWHKQHKDPDPNRAAAPSRLQRGHARDRVAEDGCDVIGRVLRAEPGARGPRPQRHARPAVQALAVQQREAARRVQLQVPARRAHQQAAVVGFRAARAARPGSSDAASWAPRAARGPSAPGLATRCRNSSARGGKADAGRQRRQARTRRQTAAPDWCRQPPLGKQGECEPEHEQVAEGAAGGHA